jgi:hypothetical protein
MICIFSNRAFGARGAAMNAAKLAKNVGSWRSLRVSRHRDRRFHGIVIAQNGAS